MGRIGVSPWVRDDAVVREKLDDRGIVVLQMRMICK
jgi:hypothetical protein